MHKHKFHTLDALRGIAAFLVVVLHFPMFFTWKPHHGWMAVDLFFVLSGFVLSHAYQQKLDRSDVVWSTWSFLKVRVIRLAPMFVLSLILSTIVTITINPLHYTDPPFHSLFWILAFLSNLFLIPFHSASHPEIQIYPFNSVYWSLFLEIIANIFHGVFLRRTSTQRLVQFTGAAALGLSAFVVIHKNQDTGVDWGSLLTGGMLRLAFSYLMGMLLYRVWKVASGEKQAWIQKLSLNPILVLAIPAVMISIPTPHEAITGLLMTLFLFPAVVLSASVSQPVESLVPIFESLGLTSYSLYLIHKPMGALIGYGFPALLGHPHWAGYVMLAVIFCIGSLFDHVYDKPVRAALR